MSTLPSTADTWLDWTRDGQDWPNRADSRFVSAGGLNWHVQCAGPETAPTILLLHGTGAASHSWRHVTPVLARHARIIAPDLPCHGFSRPTGTTDLSLPGMTTALKALLSTLGVTPSVIIGHSAGAAIAFSLASGSIGGAVPQVIGINGAFLPIKGDRLFSPMAKALFASRLSARMFSLLARTTPLGGNLLAATGSPIDPAGARLYRRLLTSSGHVRGALGMMASWDLSAFDRMLTRFSGPATLIVAEDDPMVPAGNSRQAVRHLPHGHLAATPRGGHLLHECRADLVCDMIESALAQERPAGVDAA